MKTFILAVAALMVSTLQAAKVASITVHNPTKIARQFEVVEVPLYQIKALIGNDDFILTDANGNELPYQITYDNKMVFQASVGAKKKSTYFVMPGNPSQFECKVMGRLFKERQDEFGWENDRVAYRVFGHGAAVGYDLFNKSTSNLMLDYWYASEMDEEMRSVCKKLRERGQLELADRVYNAFCYHQDHGQGMDCYTVGPTLGAGANALMNEDGSLCMPKCYKSYEILDDGLLRFSVKFTYPEVNFKGKTSFEHRIITVDAGSSFCRVDVRYFLLPGLSKMASGVVIHANNPTAFVLNEQAAYLGYEDLGDGSVYNPKYRKELETQMGKIYVGTVYPMPVFKIIYIEGKQGLANGHLVATSPIIPYEPYTYYFGSAWSKNEEVGIKNLKDWEAMLNRQSIIAKNPMKVTVSAK